MAEQKGTTEKGHEKETKSIFASYIKDECEKFSLLYVINYARIKKNERKE